MMILLSDKHKKIIDTILSEIIPASLQLKVYVFGSRAMGTAKPASDIDLAFECSDTTEMPFSVLLKLGTAFEESDLPIFVDIIDIHTTPQALKQEIIKTRCLLWQR